MTVLVSVMVELGGAMVNPDFRVHKTDWQVRGATGIWRWKRKTEGDREEIEETGRVFAGSAR